MALYTVSDGNIADAADLNQFYNLLTGSMADQPVSITNTLTVTGLTTLRGGLNVPSSSGGSVATSGYGTVPVKIGEVILTGSQPSIVFNSIPQGFRNLEIQWVARGSDSANQPLLIEFNGDTSLGSYQAQFMGSGGTSVSSSTMTHQPIIGWLPANSVTGNQYPAGRTQIPWYTSTSFVKNWHSESYTPIIQGGNIQYIAAAGYWNNASAITSITILPNVGNLTTGTSVALYGWP